MFCFEDILQEVEKHSVAGVDEFRSIICGPGGDRCGSARHADYSVSVAGGGLFLEIVPALASLAADESCVRSNDCPLGSTSLRFAAGEIARHQHDLSRRRNHRGLGRAVYDRAHRVSVIARHRLDGCVVFAHLSGVSPAVRGERPAVNARTTETSGLSTDVLNYGHGKGHPDAAV